MSDDLQTRMSNLELQNKSLKRMVMLMFVVLIGTVVYGIYGNLATPGVVSARAFEVVDGEGKPRAVLLGSSPYGIGGVDPFCMPALQLFDKHGACRATFGLGTGNNDEGVPEIRLRDHDKKGRISLSARPGETPEFKLMDRHGKEVRWP